ncbi:hypothetical protein GCM10010405_17130 [Streptomyces macrosporus]|uniref:Uncharacterized protein n=2 Tax=Streptomyces macrosporus TaxID=44032 RepID=A0ABN3JQP2_9ACTN
MPKITGRIGKETVVAAMVWLLIPLITGICAVVWAVYVQRPRRGDLWHDSARHRRLREVFGGPMPERSPLRTR